MTRVLILDGDPVVSAVLADRLEASGLRVDGFDDLASFSAEALDPGADLLLLDLELHPTSGHGAQTPLDFVRALRSRPGMGTVHVLGRSRAASPERRLEALRAGVDDVLPETCGLDELEIRIRRLLDSRTGELPLLEGNLGSHQLLEFLQYVRQAAQSGTLRVRSRRGSGRLELYRGEAIDAYFVEQRGEQALLAILGLESGRFRLELAREEGPAPDHLLDLQSVLLRAVWIEDELAQRATCLPKESAPLDLGPTLDVSPDDGAGQLALLHGSFGDLPFRAILDHVRAHPGDRRFDLLRRGLAAPQEVDLAVALLVESGLLAERATLDAPSTTELAGYQRLHWAMVSLLRRARKVGHEGSIYSLVLLAEGRSWDRLMALFAEISEPSFARLRGRLEQNRGGSLVMPVENGTVAFHVHALTPDAVGRLSPVMAACDGLVVWLDQVADPAGLVSLASRLGHARPESTGVLVVPEEGVQPTADELVAKLDRFVVSRYVPESLAGLLRFFPARETRARRAPVS